MRRVEFKPKGEARYRTIPEAAILDQLLLVSWAAELDAGDGDGARAAAAAALEGWIDAGLAYAPGDQGARLFDPCEVINFMKWEGLHGRDPYWRDHFVQTHRTFAGEFGAGDPAASAAPQRFGMTLRRQFDLQAYAEGASLRLRAPIPLAGHGLSDLSVTPVLPEGVAADATVRDQCLEVRLKAFGERDFTIGADFEFTADARDVSGPVTPLSERELELYLRPGEGLIQVTPRIEAVARELAGESHKDPVEAYWDYLMDHLLSGMVRYAEVPAEAACDWVLDNGWYDCQLGAGLLVALCRARGIPARLISGNCLYRVQPISHYWAEIWSDEAGWRPYDVMCWDLSMGGSDPAWRTVFAGRLDYRAATQCFPLAFTGPMSVRFPAAWHMIQAPSAGGIDTTYLDVDTGALIYRDHVAVRRLGQAGT